MLLPLTARLNNKKTMINTELTNPGWALCVYLIRSVMVTKNKRKKMLHAKSIISFSGLCVIKWNKLEIVQWTWVIWIIPRAEKQTAGSHRWEVTHWQERVAIRNGRRTDTGTQEQDYSWNRKLTQMMHLVSLFLK